MSEPESSERIDELMEEAYLLPESLAKVALLEEAVREADRIGWEEGAFDIRKDLMNAAAFSGAGEKLLVAFTWCLGKADEKPQLYDEQELLWEYKWVISATYQFPQVSLEQIAEMTDDYQQRLEKHGYSIRPATYLRMQGAQVTGRLDEARQYSERWPQEPRDEFADCEACELDNVVELLIDLGQYDKARQQAKPLVQGRLTCAEVPHRTLATLMLGAMAEGLDDEAARLHRKGYHMVYRNSDFLRFLGIHALYLARKRDLAKGLDVIEKHLRWAAETLELRDQLDFYIGAAAVLRAAPQRAVKLQLPESHPLHSDSEKHDAHELAGWFLERARDLCQQFNQRNGTAWQTQQMEWWLQLAGV